MATQSGQVVLINDMFGTGGGTFDIPTNIVQALSATQGICTIHVKIYMPFHILHSGYY